jgi:hypothetical protein
MRMMMCALALISLSANAQESCKDILTNGFYNEYTKSNDHTRDQAMYAELCSSDFQQAQRAIKRAQQSGGGGSLGVSYGLFKAKGGASSSSSSSFSEEQFSQWKSQYCSTNSSSNSSQASEYLMQKTVAESVVNAWSTCMQKREGLTCFASPFHDEILVSVNWKKTSLSQPQVQNSFLSKGATAEFDGTNTGKLLPSSFKMSPGTLQIPIVRQKEKNVVANINVTHDGVSHSCSVFVPGERDYELTKPTTSQQVIKSPEIGCKAKAAPFGESCSDKWSYVAPADYKVCTVELKITSGPTEGAKFGLESPTSSAGAVTWTVKRNDKPFGAGRWVHGNAIVTYVPDDRNNRDDGRACLPTTFLQL